MQVGSLTAHNATGEAVGMVVGMAVGEAVGTVGGMAVGEVVGMALGDVVGMGGGAATILRIRGGGAGDGHMFGLRCSETPVTTSQILEILTARKIKHVAMFALP